MIIMPDFSTPTKTIATLQIRKNTDRKTGGAKRLEIGCNNLEISG